MRLLTTAAATCLCATVLVTAQGQVANPTNKTGVIGMMHAIHSTNDAIQGMPAADSPEGAVLGAILGLTVRDMDETLKYWNGILRLELVGSADPKL